MNKSDSIENLCKSLVDFQKKVTNPGNTAVNPFFKSKYAPLPDILNIVRPLLGECGLAVVQSPSGNAEGVSVSTILLHSSGEWLELDPIFTKPEKATPQGIGSAITYLRRYAISAALGISSEDDDDGNEAEGNNSKTPADKKPSGNKKDKAEPLNPKIAEKIAEINALATKLSEANVDKQIIKDTIKANFKNSKGEGSANYNAIKDLGVANKVYEELKKLEVK